MLIAIVVSAIMASVMAALLSSTRKFLFQHNVLRIHTLIKMILNQNKDTKHKNTYEAVFLFVCDPSMNEL